MVKPPISPSNKVDKNSIVSLPDIRQRKKLPEQGVPIKTTITNNCCTDGPQTHSNTDLWMTTEEAASYLRISPPTLINLTSDGKVPVYKLGRRNRYLKSDFDRLLFATKRGGNEWEQSLTKKLASGRRTTVSGTRKPGSQKPYDGDSSDLKPKQEEPRES